MGYFPNGTAGMRYQSMFCDRCMNHDEDEGCPIWGLHLDWNYEQNRDTPEGEAKKTALSNFIPDDGPEPQRCRMFLRSPDEEPPEGEAYRMAVEMQEGK